MLMKNHTILIVSPDAADANVTAINLSSKGYQVLVAANWREVKEKTAEITPQVVLLSLDEAIYKEEDNHQVPRIETVSEPDRRNALGDLEKSLVVRKVSELDEDFIFNLVKDVLETIEKNKKFYL